MSKYILLCSAKHDQAATRSFGDFSSKDEMAIRIIAHFEDWKTEQDKVAMEATGMSTINDDCLEYTSEDLWGFLENFYGELVCLVKEEGPEDLWVPQTIEWVKETIQIYLRSQYSKKLTHLDHGSQVTSMEVGGN